MAQVVVTPADTATAVRPEPRSIAVDEGARLVGLVLCPCGPTITQLSVVIATPNTSDRRCQNSTGMENPETDTATAVRFVPSQSDCLENMLGRYGCGFRHRPIVRSNHPPSTSIRRCQGWHRCSITSGHRNGRSASAEVNYAGWGTTVTIVPPPSAQLSVSIVSPTFQIAVIEDGTGMIAPSGDFVVRISKAELDEPLPEPLPAVDTPPSIKWNNVPVLYTDPFLKK